jgi:hypothetical protein
MLAPLAYEYSPFLEKECKAACFFIILHKDESNP